MSYSAVILAGGDIEPDLKEATGALHKAFIKIGLYYMVEYIIKTLRASSKINKIIIAARLENIPLEIKNQVNLVVSDGPNMMKTLKNGLEPVKNEERVLVLPCDIPLLTVKALEDFLEQAENSKADLAYAYVEKETHLNKYPNIKHTYVNLKEGVFCGSGLFLLNPAIMNSAEKLFEKITQARKKPWTIAGLLGFGIIFKFIFKSLSVKDLENKVSDLLGHKTRGVLSKYPESAVNVDSVSELRKVERIFCPQNQFPLLQPKQSV